MEFRLFKPKDLYLTRFLIVVSVWDLLPLLIGQLYNLQDDPQETNNLYDRQPEMVQRLTALLERYHREPSARRSS